MEETKRKAYLNAMGIGFDYPKVALPGLEESLLLQNLKTVDPYMALPNRKSDLHSLREYFDEDASTVESKFVDSGAGHKNKAPKYKSIQPSKKSNEARTSVSSSEASSLNFSLNFYWVNESIAIIDEFPIQQSKAAKEQSLNLLRNIIGALNINVEDADFVGEKLSWPITDGFRPQGDEASAARMMLYGFIESKLEQNAFQNLIVFAGILDNLLVLQNKSEVTRDYLHCKGNKKAHITVTQSLQSMISFPALKRDVWNQLQPLRKRI